MKQRYTYILGYIIIGYGLCSAAPAQPTIITRTQRGADESLRLGNGGSSNTATQNTSNEPIINKRKIADSYLITNFPSEFHIDSIIKTRNNQSILWPISINNNKSRIVIHHTARSLPANPSYNDEINEIQDIYRFHTLSRKWGDIGYNYVIGPDGSIFEGRAGGPSAIGAHVVNNNSSSIGISLMGNFQNEKPTQAQLDATINLVARLSYTYKIDLNSKLTYHEASNEDPYITDHIDHALIGHKDAGDTSCPGVNLYNKLPSIRKQASLIAGSKTPIDTTPIITDPVEYYIPSTTYTLNIPRSDNITPLSCQPTDTIWSITSCTLRKGSLSLQLQKNTKESSRTKHRILIKTTRGNTYLTLSLQYQQPKVSIINPVTIPTTKQYYTGSKINVLLYNLSTTMNLWIMSCTKGCTIQINDKSVTLNKNTRFQLTKKNNQLLFWWKNKQYNIPNLTISNLSDGVIEILNYNRTEGNTSLNQWKGSLNRKFDTYKPIGKPQTSGITITNTVRVDDYMRGLLITSNILPQSYHDILYLAAHNNMLFRGNNITDDPRIHQYYAGFGASSINNKRQLSHDIYHNTIITHNNELTYAPRFECSDGTTHNGVYDIGICANGIGSGPGIGLSLLGAQLLSKRGYNTEQLMNYYYPNTTLTTIQ